MTGTDRRIIRRYKLEKQAKDSRFKESTERKVDTHTKRRNRRVDNCLYLVRYLDENYPALDVMFGMDAVYADPFSIAQKLGVYRSA